MMSSNQNGNPTESNIVAINCVSEWITN